MLYNGFCLNHCYKSMSLAAMYKGTVTCNVVWTGSYSLGGSILDSPPPFLFFFFFGVISGLISSRPEVPRSSNLTTVFLILFTHYFISESKNIRFNWNPRILLI